MIRRLSADEARFVAPLDLAHSHERAAVRARLARAQLELEAHARLEARLRARLPGLLNELLRTQTSALEASLRSLLLEELARLRRAAVLEVRAHPSTLATLGTSSELRAQLELEASLTLVPDDALTPGGVVIHSALFERDAQLETRVESFVSALLARGDAP